MVSNCNLDYSKGTGSCITEDKDPGAVVVVDGGNGATSTSTTTYTGSIVPWATITTTSTSNGLKTIGNSVATVGGAVLTGLILGTAFILF